MDSPISAQRFRELLEAAAQVSFVRPDELKSLSVSGLNNMIDSILQERVPTSRELQRVMDITDELGVTFPEGLGLDEWLIRVGIVSELYEGKLSDRVVIVGPMPIELGQGEAVLWIFNQVRSYRTPADEMKEGSPSNLASGIDTHYFSPEMVEKNQAPTDTLRQEAMGDLLLTNRNIYFLQNETSRIRLPISRITSLQPYAEGLHVTCKLDKPQSLIFLLDDAWFAANAIARLVQLVHR